MQIARDAIQPFRAPSQRDRAALARLIGERMREARELVGLSQRDAARRLGYANSSKLAKIELGYVGSAGDTTSSVPLWAVVRAARLYDVTTDFLLGLSDEWDPCESRVGHLFLSDLTADWDRQRERDMIVLGRYRAALASLLTGIDALLTNAGEAATALARFRELNSCFDDLPGGSRLVNAVEQGAVQAHQMRTRLGRYTNPPAQLPAPATAA